MLNKETQRTVEQKGALETIKHHENAVAEPDYSKTDVLTENQSTELTDSVSTCDVAGSINVLSSTAPVESSAEPSQDDSSESTSKASPTRPHPDLQVPAAPSKPLPVPHPRKFKKPALVRQDGLESSAQVQVAGEPKQGHEMQEAEGKGRLAGHSFTLEGLELRQDTCDDAAPPKDSGLGEDEVDVPVPPPRQTSLSPRLHRAVEIPPSLNKNNSHSLDVLSRPESMGHSKEKHWVEEDEEDGYGDFERYPITHSLPKQVKLGCHPPLANSRKAFSAEDQESSPRAPPRKPQRHSLPAPPPPSMCPPAPPHASTPMRELPAPPQEKPAWRFTRPSVTFFSRQMPTRSSVPPKSRAPTLGSKQRAQSFSAADLATRANSHKRSLSFRKLLELRLSVKMLPKLLAKGGQSLDCTSVETNRGRKSLQRPSSCIGEADICGEGVDESVEYENVPLYEEIPEYMNLPFHSARLGWPHDPDTDGSDIYEVQDPYHRCQDNEYER